ncbi:MAG TPA: HAMP domain-containing sensor histidine kinase [Cytophagaceae bacterium]|jgi:signal transduction histidine kinase|nr:HAMP domain-containing sensor histidine kinase [Cytophagaceae bacterium]
MNKELNVFLKKVYYKISRNGIREEYGRYEKEKLISFNWQIFICIDVSILLILFGFFSSNYLLSIFSVSYLFLFLLTFFSIHKENHHLAKYIYLFVTNYSVFTISFCLGYETGFYFYFFTTPLTVYITFDNSKTLFIYIALLSYLVNAITMNLLYHKGMFVNADILNITTIIVLFNLNLLMSFFMIFLFISAFVRINKLKTKESEYLYKKQHFLETQIHQKQLNETKVQYQYQKLESEYKQLDMFNHIISHNLRGPISRVSGLLELLKKFPYTSPEQQKLMGHLNTSVLMIDEVIKDLNHILIQRKLGQEETNVISIQEIFEEVKLLLSQEIQSSGAEIHDHFFVGKINCVKSILVSIFYNLISNSIKYAIPNKKPVIVIIAEINGNNLLLSFKDEGIGIDTVKYGDKIFRLYSRFHDHVYGKGMGLFLVKSHIDMLEGSIKLESIPWKGVNFSIVLPLKKV